MQLRPLPYREVKRKLEAAGFRIISQSGSHVKFRKQSETGTLITIVPEHREIDWRIVWRRNQTLTPLFERVSAVPL